MDAVENSYPEEMQRAQTIRVGTRAAGYLMIAFLGLAAREGIEVVEYESPLHNEILSNGMQGVKPKVKINPSITISPEESAERVREMFDRALREHSDHYSIEIISEPRIETNNTTSSE